MKIAIIGAAYTGLAAAGYLKQKGHEITTTTTREARVAELEPVSDRVHVMHGSDRDRMRELLGGQDAVLLTVAGGMVERDGQFVMDLDLYRDAYVGTAASLVESLDEAPGLQQIVFTSSWSAWGNAGGDDPVTEDSPSTPSTPFQEVFVEAEDLVMSAESETLNCCVYRTGTIYGPNHGPVPRALEDQTLPMAGQTIPFFDGQAPAAIVHRDDVVRALEFALEHRLSGLYNLINDIDETKEVFFGRILEEAGLEPVKWLGQGGPRNIQNEKIKAAGFAFLDADANHGSDALL